MYTAGNITELPHVEEGTSMKAPISSAKVPAPGPYSPGLTVGEWIFLSGQGGFDPNTGRVVSDDLADQTEQTFNNIETLLEAAGASLDDVVSCLVHLVDLADVPVFNAIYEQKFTGVKPVRTTVRADLVAGLLVEITVVARASSLLEVSGPHIPSEIYNSGIVQIRIVNKYAAGLPA
jgi:2-iminobutanoate/2-iminopropanoate deaminase